MTDISAERAGESTGADSAAAAPNAAAGPKVTDPQVDDPAESDPAAANAGRATTTLTVAVPTYRRPELLAALLPLLVAQCASVAELGVRAEVVVVDNDPERSAEAVVGAAADDAAAAAHGIRIRYAPEPHPGISAARNRALDEAAGSDLLAFIDDDELPSQDWLRLLVGMQRVHSCVGVLGPVIAEYQGTVDPWILAGGFFVRQRSATGTVRPIGFTGNLLLDLRVVRRHGVRFDDELGLSGGEDSLFTAQLSEAGERIYWCDEAEVLDLVPADRTTREWVLKRRLRAGTSHSRVALRLTPTAGRRTARRIALTGQGVIRMAGGAARYGYGRATRSDRHEARGLRTAYRGVGLVLGAWGYLYQEYRRPS